MLNPSYPVPEFSYEHKHLHPRQRTHPENPDPLQNLIFSFFYIDYYLITKIYITSISLRLSSHLGEEDLIYANDEM